MNNPFFGQMLKITKLSVPELEEFLEKGKDEFIPAKTILVKPGSPVVAAYFLKKGVIRHFIKGKGGKEFTKNFIRGSRFMLPSLSDFWMQTPSTIYCESITDLQVIRWEYFDLISFAEKHPRMYKFFLAGVVNAFRGKEQKEIALNQLTAKQRWNIFLKQNPELVGEVPLQFIASYLNIRPETLSRIRNER